MPKNRLASVGVLLGLISMMCGIGTSVQLMLRHGGVDWPGVSDDVIRVWVGFLTTTFMICPAITWLMVLDEKISARRQASRTLDDTWPDQNVSSQVNAMVDQAKPGTWGCWDKIESPDEWAVHVSRVRIFPGWWGWLVLLDSEDGQWHQRAKYLFWFKRSAKSRIVEHINNKTQVQSHKDPNYHRLHQVVRSAVREM